MAVKIITLNTGTKFQGYDYPGKLYRALQRNLTVPFEFECRTKSEHPGWWGKIELFPTTERTIWLDLDVVIAGNVDFLTDYQGHLCAYKDPWAPGMNSSVMSIAPGFGEKVREIFDKDPKGVMAEFHSDQEFLSRYAFSDYFQHGLIKSYKADGLQDGPKDARIAVFHGNPKNHEVDHQWVKNHWY